MIVRDLAAPELPAASAVLGRGMRDNPLHLRVFGSDSAVREATLTGLFTAVLPRTHRNGRILGAFDGDLLIGVCAMVAPGRCRLSVAEKMTMVPHLLRRISPARMLALLRWTARWERLDPPAAHWHLGPVGVDRDRQRGGVGTALMHAFVALIGDAGAYLETDKPENVRFYERFGFEVQRQQLVLDVPNWFMHRGRQRG